MPASDDNSRSVPAAPTLVAPVDASVAHGREVTFVWEPVEKATSYRLQVAPTARFDDLVLNEDVGSETAVTVGNQFPTGGETFFWRVRAVNDQGWSQEGPMESFVAVTEDKADEALAPDDEAGAITDLARAARRQVTRQVFDVEDQFEEEKERGVAYEGVAASQIMGVALSILFVILVAVAVIFGWYGQVAQEAETAASSPTNYERIQRVEREAEQQLQEYGVVDEEEGVYHIPINEAMDIVAEEQYQRSSSAGDSSPSSRQE